MRPIGCERTGFGAAVQITHPFFFPSALPDFCIALFRQKIVGFLESIFDIGLRTFDTTGLGHFLGDIHTDKEIDVGDQLGESVEFP